MLNRNGMSDHKLDACNTLCPMPVIKTQDKINELQPGDILEVTCTDPGAISDIPAWCRINGHSVLDIKEENELIIIRIKAGDSE